VATIAYTSASLPLVSLHQEILEQVAQELKRNVFKRERRTVEQLEEVQVVLEWD
jgi:hypothetical protein